MEFQQLSTWNQVAPRVYIRIWYCFPYSQVGDIEALEKHLSLSLDKLANHFPKLAGRIFLGSNPPGHLWIRLEEHARIPFKVFNQRDSFGWMYDQLKSQGFPAKAFVNKSFDLPYQLLEGQEGIPVLEIHTRIIDGGLLLCMYYHHSISDGTGMDDHISSFAELTIDPNRTLKITYPVDFDVDLPEQRIKNHHLPESMLERFHTLLGLCDEYSILPSPTGPTQFRVPLLDPAVENIQKTGRIFTIESQQINDLREAVALHRGAHSGGRLPSTFTCLAAMTWAHVTKARLPSSKNAVSTSVNATEVPEQVQLMASIKWRRRAFSDIMSTSAGNTIALPLTTVSGEILLSVCSSNESTSNTALSKIVDSIEGAIQGVDENFVALRTSLIRAAPDPRYIGLSADSCDARYFYFNTWRHFGAQARWSLPGLIGEDRNSITDGEGVAPDAIRRAQAEWNMGAGLILPAKKNSTKYEVLVTLDVDSMEVLCAEPSWKRWVNEVIE